MEILIDETKLNLLLEQMSDINKLNQITHNHSIIVIKDEFNTYSNRYLVYHDKRWDCLFFPNYKQNMNNEDYIIQHLSNELGIPAEDISLKFCMQKIHTKYSVPAEKDKVYNHYFYKATIKEHPKGIQDDHFKVGDREYYWKTLEELEQDERVIANNLDIVNYVKEIS